MFHSVLLPLVISITFVAMIWTLASARIPGGAYLPRQARPMDDALAVTNTPTRTPTPINVGNFIWHDLNANGVQESGEYGLNGIQVQLWNAAKTQLIGSATTNPNGGYTLIAPTPGDYRVRVLLPGGAFFAPKDAGAIDTADSDINPSGWTPASPMSTPSART